MYSSSLFIESQFTIVLLLLLPIWCTVARQHALGTLFCIIYLINLLFFFQLLLLLSGYCKLLLFIFFNYCAIILHHVTCIVPSFSIAHTYMHMYLQQYPLWYTDFQYRRHIYREEADIHTYRITAILVVTSIFLCYHTH